MVFWQAKNRLIKNNVCTEDNPGLCCIKKNLKTKDIGKNSHHYNCKEETDIANNQNNAY